MSTTKTKVPSIVTIPSKVDPQLKKTLDSLIEALEIRLGRRGDPRDRAITLRELIDSGLAQELLDNPFNPNAGTGVVDFEPPTALNDVTIPPAPTGLDASAAFTTSVVSWDSPQFGNFAFAEVYRGTSNNISNAVLADTTTASVWSDSLDYNQTFYYWVRFVSTSDIRGPFSGPESATTAINIAAVMTSLGQTLANLPGYSAITSLVTQGAGEVIRSSGAPTTRSDGSSALTINDIWYDTDDGNIHYRNAANNAWVAARDATLVSLFGSTSFTGSTLTAAMASAQGDVITLTGENTARSSEISTLQSSVTTKARTFIHNSSSNLPTATAVGDILIRTDQNNKMYRASAANNSSWVAIRDTSNDGKATVFTQNGVPTSGVKAGDLWFDTDDSNKQYRAMADGSDQVTAGEWEEVRDVTSVAAIASEATTRATADTANSSAITTLTAEVDDNTSAVTTVQNAVANGTSSQAGYGIAVNANNAIAGMYLMADSSNNLQNNTSTSTILFESDQVAIRNPHGSDVVPFIVLSTADAAGNPAGVYIDTGFIRDASITQAKIGLLAVDTARIADLTITNAKLAALSVDAAKIQDAAITNAKILNAAVTNAKIANASIDTAKVGSLYANTLSGDVSKAVAGSLASTVSYQNRSDTFSSAIVELALAKPTHINGWNPYAAYNINKVNTEKNSWMYVCLEMAAWNVNSQGGTSTETAATSATTSAFGNGYTGAAITNTFLTGVSGSNANNTVSVSTSVADDVAAGDIVIAGSEERTVVSNGIVFGSRLISYSGNNFSGSPNSFSFKESVTSGNVGKYVKVAEIQWVAVDTAFNDFAISGTFNANGAAVQHGVKARVRMKGQSTGSDQGTLTINITSATGFLMGVR